MKRAVAQVAADKSVLSRLGPLTAAQRADMQALINGGIDPATARAIVQGLSPNVGKATEADAPPKARPDYHQAYVAQAKQTLPTWQHAALHTKARAIAGGHAAAEVRDAPDPEAARAEELALLQQRLQELQGPIDKGTLTGSQVHVAVPMGAIAPPGRKKKALGPDAALIEQAYALVCKAGFDESQHPRADNGEFGAGGAGPGHDANGKGAHVTSSGKRFDVNDSAYGKSDWSAQDHRDAAEVKEAHGRGDIAATHEAFATAGDKQNPAASAKTTDVKLTARQKDALAGYIAEADPRGTSYSVLNNVLAGKGDLDSDPKAKAHALRDAKHLNAAIEQSTLLKEETFYRGAHMTALEAGQDVTTPRFVSVSTSKKQAQAFAYESSDTPGAMPTFFTIHAPAGTKALDVNQHASKGKFKEEREFLFGSNQAFTIVSATVEYGRQTVVMTANKSVAKSMHGHIVCKTRDIGPKRQSSLHNRLTAPTGFVVVRHAKEQGHPEQRDKTGADDLIAKASALNDASAEMDPIEAAYGPPEPIQAYNPDQGKVPDGAEGLMQANRLVAGMDAEMAAGALSPEQARRRASRALHDRPGLYDHVGTDPYTDMLVGLQLDLGAGTARAPGFIGLDLGTFGDYGNAIHDINLGLGEFPDGSVKAVRLVNSLHAILDDGAGEGDPIPLLTEIQRVLCEGGRLTYVGPEPLFEADAPWPCPGLTLADESGTPASAAAQGTGAVRQTFERIAPRVPAYHGADADFAPAGDLPIDVALAMAAYNTVPAKLAMANLINKSIGHKVVRIAKAEPMQQVLIGVVLAPSEPDLQGDIMAPEDIEAAAHGYLGTSRVIGSEHGAPIEAHPVESYIAPQDLTFDGPGGRTLVKKGSWVLGVKVVDPAEWQKVMQDGYTGFSVGGFGIRDDL